jgi:ParB-like chromosome segregation protein Spo0J
MPLWPADEVKRVPIGDLRPYPGNARTHSPEQVAQIAASMRQWGWTMPVLRDEAGFIVAGHARVEAAKQAGYTEAPCMTARGWSREQIRAYVIADNQLALNADWSKEILATEITQLAASAFDVSLLGFNLSELRTAILPGREENRRLSRSRLAGLKYQLVVDLPDENAQGELLGELRERGFACKPMIL